MTLTWIEQEERRKEKFNNWNKAVKTFSEKFESCVCSENRRAGQVEAYNLSPSLNQEITDLYSKHFEFRVEFNGRKTWLGTLAFPGQWSVVAYGKNANKFYIIRWTKEQHNLILNALANAAEENEKY